MPKSKKTTRKLEAEARQLVGQLKHELLVAETNAAMAHASARRQLCAIARDIAPHAAALARRGKPRVLAVLAKIISDPRIAPVAPGKPRRR
jgi:hypothetical protein